jgi:glycosyltransferase involved in cell wall biosynthesis
MTHTARPDVAAGPTPSPATAPIGKIVVLSGGGREAMAHCGVLLSVLRKIARSVIVVTGLDMAGGALDALDIGVADLDCGAPWGNPLNKAAEAWRLARILEAERPDALHVVGLKPALLACLALQLAPVPGVVVQLPDLVELDSRFPGGLAWPYLALAPRLLARLVRRHSSFLLVVCEADLADLRAPGVDPGARFAVLGGAGVDPDACPVLPPSPSEMPVAAYVGPVGAASGVHVLMQAFERLWARGVRLQLELHGGPDAEGGRDTLREAWTRWSLHPGVHCSGWPADTREVWRRAEICVWPSRTRQGLPRAALEAAACGRALVVTDASGGVRGFVRDDIEGVVLPAQDDAGLVAGLGAALERLARDGGLRQRMGAAARLRVLHGYTEAHVRETLHGAYVSLLAAGTR